MKTQETFKKKSALTGVPPVKNYFLISTLLENFQLCISMVMKKAGHGSVPSNPTEKYKATFLASLNYFLSDYAQKNEDAGNLQEKVSPYGCSTCGKLFPYLYPFGDFQICISMVMKKAGHGSVPSNPTESAKQHFWHL